MPPFVEIRFNANEFFAFANLCRSTPSRSSHFLRRLRSFGILECGNLESFKKELHGRIVLLPESVRLDARDFLEGIEKGWFRTVRSCPCSEPLSFDCWELRPIADLFPSAMCQGEKARELVEPAMRANRKCVIIDRYFQSSDKDAAQGRDRFWTMVQNGQVRRVEVICACAGMDCSDWKAAGKKCAYEVVRSCIPKVTKELELLVVVMDKDDFSKRMHDRLIAFDSRRDSESPQVHAATLGQGVQTFANEYTGRAGRAIARVEGKYFNRAYDLLINALHESHAVAYEYRINSPNPGELAEVSVPQIKKR